MWQTMEMTDNEVYQMMDNRQGMTTGNGQWDTLEWQTMGNGRQLEMMDNGEWQSRMDSR